MIDAVYLVRPGDSNQELRYSLRSLRNLPHRRVWLAGYQPKWTTNVGRIPVEQGENKYENSRANIRAACSHPDVTERFLLFNDDFFVVEPIDAIPVWHRGLLVDRLEGRRGGSYVRRMQATSDALGPDALSYALHVPMEIEKGKALEVLDATTDEVLFRTMYGNRWNVGGIYHDDVKVAGRNDKIPDGPLLSTSDGSFRQRDVGKRIRRLFPDPSPYEE